MGTFVLGRKFIQLVRGQLGIPPDFPIKKLVIEAEVLGPLKVYVSALVRTETGDFDLRGVRLVEDVIVESDCEVVPILLPVSPHPSPPDDPRKTVNPRFD